MKSLFYILFISLTTVCFSQKQKLTHHKIDSILKTLDTIPSLKNKVSKLSGYAGVYLYSNNTRPLINQAVAYAKQSGDEVTLSKAYYTLGNYFYFHSQLDSAYHYLKKAENFIETKDEYMLKASILNSLSGVYKKKGIINLAINVLLESKKNYAKIDTSNYTTREKYKFTGKNLVLNNSLANFYSLIEEYEKAIAYYDEAYAAAIKINAKAHAGIVLSNKGDLLLKTGNYKDALIALERAKKLKLEDNSTTIRSIAKADLMLGIANHKSGFLNAALKNFNIALEAFNKINNDEGIANTLFERGNLYNTLNAYKKAILDCEQAKELAYKISDLEFQISSCECLFKAYKETGNFKKALEHFELVKTGKDSIFNEKNIKKITQLQMQYEFDKEQEKQRRISEKVEQQRKTYLTLALSGFVIISLLGFFILKNRKKNRQISQALQEKEVLLKEIHHRVKNNLQVVSSLLSLQQRQTKDNTAHQALQEGRNRVKAMALIHQFLYQDKNLVGVEAKPYITKLVTTLVTTYKTNRKNIDVQTQIEPIKLDVDTIIPLGLILNELISNALKYAFETKNEGIITITLNVVNTILILQIKDNGTGLPKDFSVENSSSLGYKLVHSFSQKLDADLVIENSDQGVSITLKIKKFKTI